MLIDLTLREPLDLIYFASWHGPHKVKTDTKTTKIKKLIKNIREVTIGRPFIIGGDFNLKASEFPSMDCGVKIIKCDENDLDPIDYFVFVDFCNSINNAKVEKNTIILEQQQQPTPTFSVTEKSYAINILCASYEGNVERLEYNIPADPPLDHQPIKAYVNIKHKIKIKNCVVGETGGASGGGSCDGDDVADEITQDVENLRLEASKEESK